MSVIARVPALAPFQVRSFRFQWPADLLASWAFEMEGVILGWFVLVSTGSVLALAVFGSLQFLGTLVSPFFGMAGDRIGNRNVLCLMRATYLAVASGLAALFLRATAFRPGWTARLIPARANGQPAFGFYARDPDTGDYYTVGLMVLTLSGPAVCAMTRFDPGILPRFGLPASLGN